MINRISKSILLFSTALLLAAGGYAQDTKIKTKEDEYKLKTKSDDNKLKIKRKGAMAPMESRKVTTTEKEEAATSYGTTDTRAAEQEASTIAVKPGKTAYAGRKVHARAAKKCTCARMASRRHYAAGKRSVAHRSNRKASHTAMAKVQAEPRIVREVVHDTMYVVHYDTVYRVRSAASYSGYRTTKDNYKKLKIKKEDDEIILKKKYEDGEKVIKTFDNEREFNKYRKWKGGF